MLQKYDGIYDVAMDNPHGNSSDSHKLHHNLYLN